jgi:G3E family GTPase
VVELDYPVDISEVSRVMENLLLSFAEQLMRYKGMLWIDGEPNRLLFQGVQRLYSADWDRPWGDEAPHSTLVFIGINLPEEEIRAAFAAQITVRRSFWRGGENQAVQIPFGYHDK